MSLVSRRLTRDKAPAMTSKGDVKTALAAQVLGAETTVFAVLCTLGKRESRQGASTAEKGPTCQTPAAGSSRFLAVVAWMRS